MSMFRTQLHSPPLLVLAFFLPLLTDRPLCGVIKVYYLGLNFHMQPFDLRGIPQSLAG